MFGSMVYYSNPGRSQKLIRDEAYKGILIRYEGDTREIPYAVS
jgi:hypothetical protein